ncbi:MAG: 50S ribosomal protein L10 [Patescibacteria group bacterium]
MPNQKNINAVIQLRKKLSTAKSIIFADYKGLKSTQADELRAKLAETGAEVEVTKNTLLKVAFKDEGIETKGGKEGFEGSTLTVIAYEDAFTPIKKLFEFIKSANVPLVKLGFIDGKFYSKEQVEDISKLPSRLELITKVLVGFNAPVSGFVNVLSGTKRNFVYVLNAIASKKEGGSS